MLNIKAVDNIYEPTFRDMIFAYWQELMPKASALETPEKREAYFRNDFGSGDVYGTWLNDKLVGYIHLRIKNQIGVISGIYTIPEVRRHGIGTQMMQWAFDQFDSVGVEQIDLYVRRDNPKAMSFYEALGFGIAGYRMRMYRKDGQVLPGVLSSDL